MVVRVPSRWRAGGARWTAGESEDRAEEFMGNIVET